MKNKQVITVIVCTILVFILVRACTNMLNEKIRNDIENETTITKKSISESKNEYLIKYSGNWEIIIDYFLMGRIEYNEMPLSEKFKKKYPSLDSFIKGKCTGESSDSLFDEYDKNSNIMTIRYKTGKGFEEIGYKLHYVINDKNELDDIEILDSRVVIDEDGHYPKYEKYHYFYDDPIVATDILCFPYRMDRDGDYYRIFVTKDFEEKFPDCQNDDDLNDGIVGDKDYLICGNVIQDNEHSNVFYVEKIVCVCLQMHIKKAWHFSLH